MCVYMCVCVGGVYLSMSIFTVFIPLTHCRGWGVVSLLTLIQGFWSFGESSLHIFTVFTIFIHRWGGGGGRMFTVKLSFCLRIKLFTVSTIFTSSFRNFQNTFIAKYF